MQVLQDSNTRSRSLRPCDFSACSWSSRPCSTATAVAHAPMTAIGRAVTAFGVLTVSYDPEAVVSDVEAGGFPQIVGSDPKVAFLPASTNQEIRGGPNAVADEIAREAGLEGTLIVLVGNRLGAWSDDIGEDRLAELVARRTSNRLASGGGRVARARGPVRAARTGTRRGAGSPPGCSRLPSGGSSPSTGPSGEDLDLAIERVPLDGYLPDRPDQVHELVGRRPVGRARPPRRRSPRSSPSPCRRRRSRARPGRSSSPASPRTTGCAGRCRGRSARPPA